MSLYEQMSPLIKNLNTPHPGKDEERQLITAYKRGCRKAYTELIERNIGLVRSQAHKLWKPGLDINDLVQEGVEGLNRALEKFDLSRSERLSTYAMPWIYQKIQRYIASNTGALRCPIHIYTQIGQMFKIYRRFEVDNNLRPPTEEEMASLLDCSAAHYRLIFQAAQQVTSLDRPIGDDEFTLADVVPDKAEGVESRAARAVDAKRVEALLGKLTSREERILRLRFGLTLDQTPRTLQDVSERFGLTRERIRQIEKEAIRKLQESVGVV